MDHGCESVLSVLGRVVEGEATPEETYRVARHVPRCTSCRIMLARERRLAAALDGLTGSDPGDPELLDRVMTSLPRRPAAGTKPSVRQLARRGLRLAMFLSAIPVAAAVSASGSGWQCADLSWASVSPTAETWGSWMLYAAGSAASISSALREIVPRIAIAVPDGWLLAGAMTSLALAGGGFAAAVGIALAAGVPRRTS